MMFFIRWQPSLKLNELSAELHFSIENSHLIFVYLEVSILERKMGTIKTELLRSAYFPLHVKSLLDGNGAGLKITILK